MKRKKMTKLDLLKRLLADEKFNVGNYKQRTENLSREIDGLNVTIADQRKRIAELADQVNQWTKRAVEAGQERDRIMRVVDQFTSVQILSPSQETRNLRKT